MTVRQPSVTSRVIVGVVLIAELLKAGQRKQTSGNKLDLYAFFFLSLTFVQNFSDKTAMSCSKWFLKIESIKGSCLNPTFKHFFFSRYSVYVLSVCVFLCLLAYCSFVVYKMSQGPWLCLLFTFQHRNKQEFACLQCQNMLSFVLGSVTDTLCVWLLLVSQDGQ